MTTTAISRFVPARIKVLTVSPGGCGTTMLMDFFAERTTSNDPGDRDGLKHFPGPPLPLNPRCRVIYLHGDPVDMCVSLFRRGYASHQSAKINRTLGNATPLIVQGETIDEYAAKGTDCLGFNQHFGHWHNDPRPYDVAFVRYDTLWDHLPKVLDFAGLDPRLAAGFPARLERHRTDHISPETTRRLVEIYEPLRVLMAPLGGFHVSPAKAGMARGLATLRLASRAVLPSLSWAMSCHFPAFHLLLRWVWRAAFRPR
jgi:hypothetical protein